MIIEFVQKWDEKKSQLRTAFEQMGRMYLSYDILFEMLVKEVLFDSEDYFFSPDPERITVINHGHYQGTIVFVVAQRGYQPSTYWATSVGYGSCSLCDTLQSIMGLGDWDAEKFSDEQIESFMTLCLHMLQGIKEI